MKKNKGPVLNETQWKTGKETKTQGSKETKIKITLHFFKQKISNNENFWTSTEIFKQLYTKSYLHVTIFWPVII